MYCYSSVYRTRFLFVVNFQVCYLQFDKQDSEMEKFLATCLEGEFSVFITKNKYNNKFPRIGEKVIGFKGFFLVLVDPFTAFMCS